MYIYIQYLVISFVLKSIPTVDTNTELKEFSVYRSRAAVFPTAVLPTIKILYIVSLLPPLIFFEEREEDIERELDYGTIE